MLEAERADETADEEARGEHGERREPPAVGQHFAAFASRPAPVGQLAELDADVGQRAGDVVGTDLGPGELGDHRVLQVQEEAQQHDGGRHEQSLEALQARARDAEADQQHGFE